MRDDLNDLGELARFFASPPDMPGGIPLGAQQYDPKGSGFCPFTDGRLERLMPVYDPSGAVVHANPEWHRVKRILDGLSDAHVEVLRLALGALPIDALSTKEFRWPEVAARCSTARARGIELAIDARRTNALESAYVYAQQTGCSGPCVAQRVLETDRLIEERLSGIRIDDGEVIRFARLSLERATSSTKERMIDSEYVVSVKVEMNELVLTSAEAYRTMRRQLGGSKRAEKARLVKANEELLKEKLGASKKRETDKLNARYAAKLAASRTKVG